MTVDIIEPEAPPEPKGGSSEFRAEGRSAEELTELTAGGLKWMTMSRAGSELVLMASTVVLARIISPDDFGAFAVALIVAGLAIAVPTSGVTVALVQRDVITREHLQAGNALALIITALIGSLTVLLSYVVIGPLIGSGAADLVRLCCPMFLLYSVGSVSTAILQRRLDFRRLALMEICGNAARVVVSLGAAVIGGLGGSALVLGLLAGAAITSLIAITGAPPPPPRLRRGPVRDISGFGLPGALAAIAWTGFANGDYAVVAARLGTAAAGQYWRAYTLAVSYQSKVSVLMGSVAFPVLSRSATTEDLLALRARMVRVLTVVLFPILTGLAITAPVVVPAAYGHAWESAVAPTQVLCIGGAATLVINAIGSVLMATGRGRGLLAYGLGHFVVYVGSVVFVAHLGLVAVAIDGAIVHSLFAVVAYGMVARRTGQGALGAMWADIKPASVACLVMAAAAVPVDLAAQSAHLVGGLRFVAVFATCAVTYLLALKIAFPPAWGDVLGLFRRLMPARALAGMTSLRLAVRRSSV